MDRKRLIEWNARLACRWGLAIIFGSTFLGCVVVFGMRFLPPPYQKTFEGIFFYLQIFSFAGVILGTVTGGCGLAALTKDPSLRHERIMGRLTTVCGVIILILGTNIPIEGGLRGSPLILSTPKDRKTLVTIAELTTAIAMYEVENNKYPTNLQVLVDVKLVTRIKTDGWGRPLNYDPLTGEISSRPGNPLDKKAKPISSLDL